MTEPLTERTCLPCRGGTPPLTAEAARGNLEQAREWTMPDDTGHIERKFWFSNVREALDFARAAGELAEAEQHHPDIAFGWGYATISPRTKKIKGPHRNDFIMAVKIDRLGHDHGALDGPRRRRQSSDPGGTHVLDVPRRAVSINHRQ